MGYNSFGNILFYGLGMYICASVQVGMFFPLAEWTESGGEKTFIHSPTQFFQGMAFGLLAAAIIPTIGPIIAQISLLIASGFLFMVSRISKYRKILMILGSIVLISALIFTAFDMRI